MNSFAKGYEIIENFLPEKELASILEQLANFTLPASSGGIRHIDQKATTVAALARSAFMRDQAERYLTGSASFVRAILFDKTPDNNWLVSWHQDKTLAVSMRFELLGWGPWSHKEGVHHVQPPVDVLEQMVTFRIHLDKADQKSGSLRVMPSSHTLGLLSQADIQQYITVHEPLHCVAPVNSALVMRPHLLHASSKAATPSRRRVLHLEYCSYKLPEGVGWA